VLAAIEAGLRANGIEPIEVESRPGRGFGLVVH